MSSDINVSPSPLAGEGRGEGAQATASEVDNIAIRVSNLSKCYTLYDAPRDRLKQFVLPRLQRVVGKPPKNYYREFWALKDVSFEVRKGETVGIVGRNGSGKSTLLQLICGTLTPTSGNVETNGRIAALLELGSGFNPEFSGRENVYLNGRLLGLDHSLIESRFDDIAAFADIGDYLDQPVKTYSSGMFVRLAFAVLAFSDSDVLIVDEALAVGDAVFTQKCTRYIRRFRETGTLFFVSHNMQSVLDLCDRAIWLNQGAIQFQGDSIEVVREYSAHIHQLVTQDAQIMVTRAAKDKEPKPRMRNENPKEVTFPYRLELFDFDFDAPYWGKGGARVEDVQILDSQKRPSKLLTDCGEIEIRVHCRALTLLRQPVVGFSLRNSRGVELISDNSYLALRNYPPPPIAEGRTFIATFKFFLPYLAPGEYTLGAAVADGIPGNHTQHHRRDEALRFTVVSSHVKHGLLSMPLTECRISFPQASVAP